MVYHPSVTSPTILGTKFGVDSSSAVRVQELAKKWNCVLQMLVAMRWLGFKVYQLKPTWLKFILTLLDNVCPQVHNDEYLNNDLAVKRDRWGYSYGKNMLTTARLWNHQIYQVSTSAIFSWRSPSSTSCFQVLSITYCYHLICQRSFDMRKSRQNKFLPNPISWKIICGPIFE